VSTIIALKDVEVLIFATNSLRDRLVNRGRISEKKASPRGVLANRRGLTGKRRFRTRF
jgi:hypothetical protein